jgi:D-3-phosphoglycerate dehydrogenase / 2-oxoglutarate reductase
MKVLIGPSAFAAEDRSPLDLLDRAGVEVVPNPHGRKLTRSELQALLSGVSGLLAGLEPLTREVMAASELKVISRVGAGMSNVDLDAARELGIAVLNTPDAPTNAVAELTIGAMITLLRSLPVMDRDLHAGKWNKRVGLQLEGRAVVIAGFGRIGRRVAELLAPFRSRVIVVDPLLQSPPPGVELMGLEEALPLAEVVSVHASGESEILGSREFALLRRGAFVLNAGRGGLVNEELLVSALETGAVAGAWVDTFVEEPYSGALARFAQVIVSPHIGSASREARLRMETEAVRNLLSVLAPGATE